MRGLAMFLFALLVFGLLAGDFSSETLRLDFCAWLIGSTTSDSKSAKTTTTATANFFISNPPGVFYANGVEFASSKQA
jgi:hypothetical protein